MPSVRGDLVDRYGRRSTYLRISVTDRCNLRCVYCMPPEGIELYPRERFLTYEEFVRVARVAAQAGVRKVRLTGGEPLVRKGAVDLVKMLSEVPEIESLGLTTNGLLLESLAAPLKEAGLGSINVSLDSLDPERYARITRGGDLGKVWRGILAAREVGLPLKLNVVALRDLTLAEAIRLVNVAARIETEVRFIEFMPLCGTGWRRDEFVPLTGLEHALRRAFRLEPVDEKGVARVFRVSGTKGRVGFIASLSNPFCATCSRLRLTATGRLQPCLFSPFGIELLPILRGPGGDAELLRALSRGVLDKPAGHGIDLDRPTLRPTALIRSVGG